MRLAAVIVLYVLVGGNFAYSLRLAYSMAINANGGGYPILGHVVQNFFSLLFALILLPKAGEAPFLLSIAAVAALPIVPAVNAWLIVRLNRLGEHCRAVASDSHGPPPLAKGIAEKQRRKDAENA
ncbi:MAG: hypothetical protein JWN40_785 [Phycisphaerales bacterium]|nr:hypothetical protein [Phycisphaerales bacterium]